VPNAAFLQQRLLFMRNYCRDGGRSLVKRHGMPVSVPASQAVATAVAVAEPGPVAVAVARRPPVRWRAQVNSGPGCVEYHATMESCSDKFHVDIPNVV
jgi:hypothetical protein